MSEPKTESALAGAELRATAHPEPPCAVRSFGLTDPGSVKQILGRPE